MNDAKPYHGGFSHRFRSVVDYCFTDYNVAVIVVDHSSSSQNLRALLTAP